MSAMLRSVFRARAIALNTAPRTSLRFYSSADGNPPIMSQIREGLKSAMKSGNNTEKTVLRSIISEVKNRNISDPGSVGSNLKFVGMVRSMIATRQKSIEEYKAANRNDLVEKEASEIEILNKYAGLISVASDAEVDAKVKAVIDALPEADRKSMNKIMGKIPWNEVESSWNSTRNSVAGSVKRVIGIRSFSTSARVYNHSNPLGLPQNGRGAPRIPKQRPSMGITRRHIPGVKRIIAVSSAKGGVGKSTVSANIALSLFNQGLNVGILDVDIFGPSVPKLFNLSGEPVLNDDGKLVPLVNYGVKTMSMGYLVDPNKAVAWRGLLIQKALEQLLFDVEWGGIDVLVLDMPPGTGDVQLTIAQQVQVDGAVIVSTPQDMALIDAIRGIELYKIVKVPILGMVQNMSMFVCPNCNHSTHIFGTDGAIREAEKRSLDVLGSIPLAEDICLSSDNGKPIVVSDANGYSAKIYDDIASKIANKLNLKVK